MINLGSFRTRIAKSLTNRGPKGPVKQSPKLLLCKIHQNFVSKYLTDFILFMITLDVLTILQRYAL